MHYPTSLFLSWKRQREGLSGISVQRALDPRHRETLWSNSGKYLSLTLPAQKEIVHALAPSEAAPQTGKMEGSELGDLECGSAR